MASGAPQRRQNANPTADWALEEARRVVLDELKGRAKVVLFGSWAKGTADRLSDIDIGIWLDDDVPSAVLAHLRERFEESDIPYHVDVVDLRETDEAFRDRVLAEGIAWAG